jgi:outer membrane protein OmpA-like peptidoglycan-associated protein
LDDLAKNDVKQDSVIADIKEEVENPVQKFLPEYVRFALDSYVIRQSERSKIDDAISYLNAYPNAKLLLIGYADRQTGNPKYNMNLSHKRVNVVAKQLENLGIDPKRLILEWRGDIEQPYMQNDWNRVVIMVGRE